MKLVIEVTGLPAEVLEENKYRMVSAVEDIVDDLIETEGDFVSWDVVDD